MTWFVWPIVTVILVALGGCAPATSSDGVCLALAPHLPGKVRAADTAATKSEAYVRNRVYQSVCDVGAR